VNVDFSKSLDFHLEHAFLKALSAKIIKETLGDFERVNLCFKVIPISATRFITVQWSGSNIIKVELVPKNIQEHL
jgi:hypothetical protein